MTFSGMSPSFIFTRTTVVISVSHANARMSLSLFFSPYSREFFQFFTRLSRDSRKSFVRVSQIGRIQNLATAELRQVHDNRMNIIRLSRVWFVMT